jgi:hypothetical protein
MEIKRNLDRIFGGLILDESTHTYYLKDKPLKSSVSGLIKNFYPKTDFSTKTKGTELRLNISKEEVLKMWRVHNLEAITRGNRVHIFGENYPYNKTLIPSCPQELAVKKFWDDLPKHIILVGVEIRMYHKTYLFPGTMDILLYDTIKNHYIIADYKTNKDLLKNFNGQKLYSPFSHLLDSPLNHYQIQLSFYQILLEQAGIHVGERKIIHLDLEGNYQMWDTEDLTSTLKTFLKKKYENI